MLVNIAAFELRYQLRQPAFHAIALLFFALAFGCIAIDGVQIGSGGNVLKNAPYAIAQIHLILTVFSMLMTAGFVAGAVVRDDDTGFAPIMRALPVGKTDYILGRFSGAFAAALLCFLAVPLGAALGSLMPWVDAEALGPLRISDYAFAYFIIAVPGLWFSATTFFALATVTRSMMWTYVGVIAALVSYVTAQVLLDRPEWQQLVAFIEPFGFSAIRLATRYWTASERNQLMPPLSGALLGNRIIWTAAGALMLGCAHARFRFETRGRAATESKRLPPPATTPPFESQLHELPQGESGLASALRQLRARTAFEVHQVFRSPALLVLLALGMFNATIALWFAGDEPFAAEIYPVTRIMIQALLQSFSLVPMVVAIYYAGELVWRERSHRIHEIVDATPAPDWVMVVPKVLALVLALLAILLGSALVAIAVQTAKGYTHFELAKYLRLYVAPAGIDWALIAVLAVFLQALAPQKLLGWGLMVLYLVATLVAANLGFEHNLYLYGRSPAVALSDMNPADHFASAAAWFRFYWAAFALLLMLLTHALWPRGCNTSLKERLGRLPHRLAGPVRTIGVVAAVCWIASGAYIFINTNVWNEYRSNQANERLLADMERALLGYEHVPQPVPTFVELDLDLDPHRPRLVTRGSYILQNKTESPLRSVHVRWDPDLTLEALTIEGARLARDFGPLHYRIFQFDRPLAPGEQRRLTFTSLREQRGFTNNGGSTRLVDNGTFVANSEFAPTIGMNRQSLLNERAKRRKYGLPPEARMAKLDDAAARARNYAGFDWVRADITVTTVADQTPIAPGYKVSDVTRNGRRTARFVSEAPINFFFCVQSANYSVKTENHHGVELAVYYDEQHPWNVSRMIRALRVGLDYFQASFGPYQFRQARIVEFPAYNAFAQSFANTMPYSEGLGFIADLTDPDRIDFVTYITAHELAHQWWAHQVVGADTRGATVLSETLAQYSALMVMEKIYGPDQVRRFLEFELDRYLKDRAGEAVEEPSLAQVENQGYIHYNKGSLVMYLLKDRMGEQAVNRALAGLIERFAFKAAPYPTSLDLVAALRNQAPADQQQLITDLFEHITLYDFKALQATAKRRPDGRYEVALTVEARKLYATGKGVETPAPFTDAVDFGLFVDHPADKSFTAADVLRFERRPLRSGRQRLTAIVDRVPAFAGIDPYNKWIDRNPEDNLVSVEIE